MGILAAAREREKNQSANLPVQRFSQQNVSKYAGGI